MGGLFEERGGYLGTARYIPTYNMNLMIPLSHD